jgi:hypothetical protein
MQKNFLSISLVLLALVALPGCWRCKKKSECVPEKALCHETECRDTVCPRDYEESSYDENEDEFAETVEVEATTIARENALRVQEAEALEERVSGPQGWVK